MGEVEDAHHTSDEAKAQYHKNNDGPKAHDFKVVFSALSMPPRQPVPASWQHARAGAESHAERYRPLRCST
jgi:hypothetical protein